VLNLVYICVLVLTLPCVYVSVVVSACKLCITPGPEALALAAGMAPRIPLPGKNLRVVQKVVNGNLVYVVQSHPL